MRSIERRFTSLTEVRPSLSSIINFAGAVKGQGFSKGAIARWFNTLVEKDDFEASDKRQILRFMVSISTPEDGTKQG